MAFYRRSNNIAHMYAQRRENQGEEVDAQYVRYYVRNNVER